MSHIENHEDFERAVEGIETVTLSVSLKPLSDEATIVTQIRGIRPSIEILPGDIEGDAASLHLDAYGLDLHELRETLGLVTGMIDQQLDNDEEPTTSVEEEN